MEFIEEDAANAFFDPRFGDLSSATVDNEVPAVVRSELSELCHVLLEYPLESDCLGKADLLESSNVNPRP